jgi:hypothetical protein
MTTELHERRKGQALTLFLIAGALALVAAVTTGIEMRSSRPDLASGQVVPGLGDTIAGAERILITSTEASYRIECIQRGEECVWVMRDRGDYPVTAARLNQLTEGLENLRLTRRMTNDPSKYERLGVGDPREGGGGVLVQVEDSRGALLVNLILGVEPSGLYVRRPDDAQAYAAIGELPPLRDAAAWLELRPLALDPARLARVEIVPAEGRPYILAREAADQPWRMVSPPLGAIAQTTVAAAAERLTQIAPADVQTAPAIQGAARARVRATTYDGVIIDAELILSDGRTWLKLVARASTPEQEAAALEINSRSSAWAYALSDMEAESVAPPFSALVPSAAPPSVELQ